MYTQTTLELYVKQSLSISELNLYPNRNMMTVYVPYLS